MSKICNIKYKFPYVVGFSLIPHCRQNTAFSLGILAKMLSFTSPIPRKCASHLLLQIHCILPKERCFTQRFSHNDYLNSALSLKTQSFTPFFAEDAQYDPKTGSYADNAKFHWSFLATSLSKNGSDQKFRISRRIWKRLSKMLQYCILYLLMDEWLKKWLKTDHGNFVLVHLKQLK